MEERGLCDVFKRCRRRFYFAEDTDKESIVAEDKVGAIDARLCRVARWAFSLLRGAGSRLKRQLVLSENDIQQITDGRIVCFFGG